LTQVAPTIFRVPCASEADDISILLLLLFGQLLLNETLQIEVIEFGIIIEVNLLFINVKFQIEVIEFGIIIEANLLF
jgi:hypothetical protein